MVVATGWLSVVYQSGAFDKSFLGPSIDDYAPLTLGYRNIHCCPIGLSCFLWCMRCLYVGLVCVDDGHLFFSVFFFFICLKVNLTCRPVIEYIWFKRWHKNVQEKKSIISVRYGGQVCPSDQCLASLGRASWCQTVTLGTDLSIRTLHPCQTGRIQLCGKMWESNIIIIEILNVQ